jgi:predicted benzoate:H+ symporter BenE
MNAAVFSAGASAFLWYAFGALPLQLSVADQLGLDPARASSWISIVWMSGAAASIAISLRYRQPIPITWTIPGLVLLEPWADSSAPPRSRAPASPPGWRCSRSGSRAPARRSCAGCRSRS